MENTSSDETQPITYDNIVYIEFFNKKDFPTGEWSAEPDFVQWSAYGLQCLAIRDMKLGSWRGFVGLEKSHKGYSQSHAELLESGWMPNLEVHGTLTFAGKLPAKYKELNKSTWWVGFECSHGTDYLPLVKVDQSSPFYTSLRSQQVYKNIHFVRKQTNQLAKQLLRINRK